MAVIKNIHLLGERVSPADQDKMEHGALQHKRYSNISFKIVEVKPSSVTFQVVQGRSAQNNYQSKARLIEIVHETFGRFFPESKILVHAVPYKKPATNVVDYMWIKKQMLKLGIKVKQMADETGVDHTQLTAYMNGTRPLSATVKAMFFFYFETKQLEPVK